MSHEKDRENITTFRNALSLSLSLSVITIELLNQVEDVAVWKNCDIDTLF